MATQRKKSPKKQAKVVREEELTPLDYHAIQLHELFSAYKRAGFDHGTAITLICDSETHPNWFKQTTINEFREWDDFKDEDDSN